MSLSDDGSAHARLTDEAGAFVRFLSERIGEAAEQGDDELERLGPLRVLYDLDGAIPHERELEAHDPLPEGEHLGVVGEDSALNGEVVVGGDGPRPLDLVGRDGHAETGAADQQRSVGLACSHQLCRGDGHVGVGVLGGR